MDSFRKIVKQGVDALEEKGHQTKVVAFDGQFLEAAVRDYDGNPVTLCKLDKLVWEKAKSTKKQDQIAFFTSLNAIGKIRGPHDLRDKFDVSKADNGSLQVKPKQYQVVFAPQNLAQTSKTEASSEQDGLSGFEIIGSLPTDVVESMDNDLIDNLTTVHTTGSAADATEGPDDEEETVSAAMNLQSILVALIASAHSEKRLDKWSRLNITELDVMLSTPESINSHFIVDELKTVLDVCGHKTSGKKGQLVNCVSRLIGSGSSIPVQTHVETLRSLALKKLKAMPKADLNILYATNTYVDELQKFDEQAHFPAGKAYTIRTKDTSFTIDRWYSQPIQVNGKPVQFIIDPHHILVNNRCRSCSNGMPAMDIDPKAWVQVAELESGLKEDEKTGLSHDLVVELRDRQRNSYALTTFSEEVEKVMERIGHKSEATWCRLMRQFYRATDEAGLQTSTRIQWLLDIRQHLLKYYKPGTFPPPGSYVADLPMAQFEGIMTNVDRRLQLYALLEQTTYNYRAVSSLDSETFFGTFQVSEILQTLALCAFPKMNYYGGL